MPRTGRPVTAKCGTPAGYNRHKLLGEPIDNACAEAEYRSRKARWKIRREALKELRACYPEEYYALVARRSGPNAWNSAMSALGRNHREEYQALYDEIRNQ